MSANVNSLYWLEPIISFTFSLYKSGAERKHCAPELFSNFIIIARFLSSIPKNISSIKEKVLNLTSQFPVYSSDKKAVA